MTDSSERTHRTGELFVCFTSRVSSSSSMKLSSKSILSPGRAARDVPISLSTSLSRRLRTNRSLRGAQSPMFPAVGKKRGCTFENPEPSSPKVTCIGQVRVKTKKQGKKMRTLSRRRGTGGEVSFRRVEQSHGSEEGLRQRNQRWVHLPVTICEALREFSCLFPCKSSCFSAKEEKTASSREEATGQSSCGAALARWFVALHDGDGGRGREVELVVGEDEEVIEAKDRTFRRHAMEAVEIRDENFAVKEGDEEEARLSVCVPPKNALLLMRCRSDPMKMSALANRLWEYQAPTGKDEEEEEQEEEEEEEVEGHENAEVGSRLMEDKRIEKSEELVSAEADQEVQSPEPEAEATVSVEETEGEENNPEGLVINDELQEEEEENLESDQAQIVAAEENELSNSPEAFLDPETSENEAAQSIQEEEEEKEETGEEDTRLSYHSSSEALSVNSFLTDNEEAESEVLAEEEEEEEEEEKSTEEKETQQSSLKEEEILTQVRDETEQTQVESRVSEEREEAVTRTNLERESSSEERESNSDLPECLLLMRCEPKLSMEVSKETWVCSRDFIRWRRPVSKTDGGDEAKKRLSTDSNASAAAAAQLPPRMSCSAVTGMSVATMIEQKKLGVGVGFEPFVLTRCKSEPMRTAAAKLTPETRFWKSRHRRAVGAAGVGF